MPGAGLNDLHFVGSGLVRPECVLANAAGNLYTADWRGGVAHIRPDGSQTLYAGPGPDGLALKPNGVALLRDGSFLITHLGNEDGGVFRVQRNGQVEPWLQRVDGQDLPPSNFVVEDALGRVRFLLFYLACGVVAALSQTFITAAAGDALVPMVGASGAIAGVLAGYMVLFPRARVLTLIFIIFIIRLVYLPASLFIGFWFAVQLLSALAGAGAGSGVAFVAHVGGFVAGFVLVKLMGPMRGYRRPGVW